MERAMGIGATFVYLGNQDLALTYSQGEPRRHDRGLSITYLSCFHVIAVAKGFDTAKVCNDISL